MHSPSDAGGRLVTSPHRLLLDVGQRVRQRRVAMGYSQTELAHAAGISRPTLVRFENGERSPSLDVVARIAIALECEAEVRELFPAPDTRSIEDLVRPQPRRRVSRRRR